GLVIAAVIIVVLVQAVKGVGERLLDGVDPALLDQASTAAASVSGVEAVDEVRARWIGHRLHADVRLTVDRDLDVAAAHHIATDVEHALLQELPAFEAAVVHVNPCTHEASSDV
ncbi:MAG TPA: cation transporter dimerization domain-containing protein, partial [Acidimicrobiales bacterium]|nr:cation transporter dimerization domain-containing protein [Acidimicrobiales bacterium]